MSEMFSELKLQETPLSGSLVIEASAGTGKTYALTHLVLRLIVEKGISTERILMVTFTRDATYELKRKLQKKLEDALAILREDKKRKKDPTLEAQVNKWLTKRGGNIHRDQIEKSLESALLNIEDASIHTIDAFSQLMLTKFNFPVHGMEGLRIGDTNWLEFKTTDKVARKIVKQLKDDTAKILFLDLIEKYGHDILQKIGRAFKDESLNKQFEINLYSTCYPEVREAIEKFLRYFPEEFNKELLASGMVDFDDVLALMEKCSSNKTFADSVRNSFDAALIDEFQDTSPKQYAVFKKLFCGPEWKSKLLVLVGDPKQSIYSFRSADLETYLEARKEIGSSKNGKVATITCNYRSTPGLVKAANYFFQTSEGHLSFLRPDLSYFPIKAKANEFPLFRIQEDTLLPVVPLRILAEDTSIPFSTQPSDSFDSQANNATQDEEEAIKNKKARAVANDIEELLSGYYYIVDTKQGKAATLRKVEPRDIVVLVSARHQADELKRELGKRGIRYIAQGNESIFKTVEADEMLRVLSAMDEPRSAPMLRLARSTRIFGETLNDFRNEEKTISAGNVIDETIELFYKKGIIAALKALFNTYSTESRLLKELGGERRITNYQHLLELLNVQNQNIKTISGLLSWLRQEIQKNEEGISKNTERALRPESDDGLVRIETIHQSKGLQYPIVYLLDSCRSIKEKLKDFSLIRGKNGKTILNIGEPTDLNVKEQIRKQEAEEEIRKYYVAFTRASSHLVLPLFYESSKDKPIFKKYLISPVFRSWCATLEPDGKLLAEKIKKLKEQPEEISYSKEDSPNMPAITIENIHNLDEILHERKLTFLDTSYPSQLYEVKWLSKPKDDHLSGSNLENNKKPKKSKLHSPKPHPQNSPSWIRSSFSSLSSHLDWTTEGQASDESVEGQTNSEENLNESISIDSLMEEEIFKKTDVPDFRYNVSSTKYGNFIHDLLKDLDFTLLSTPKTKKNAKLIDNLIMEKIDKFGINNESDEDFKNHVAYLKNLVENALKVRAFDFRGGMSNFSLNQLQPNQRNSEMEFLLSVGQPIEGREQLTPFRLRELLGRIGFYNKTEMRYLKEHEKSNEEPKNFSDGGLTGYLTGSIDLAFFAQDKFWIIDWKTNFISPWLSDYTENPLKEEMRKHNYRLQLLLYTIALKRYLESRFGTTLSDGSSVYKMFGGAAYYFLRGIQPNNPTSGIYFERPSQEVVDCIDDALKNGYKKI